jgi:hypothetical protein
MTPLAQRIRDTRGALIHWDEQMVRDIATANPPALEHMTMFLYRGEMSDVHPEPEALTNALLSFALMRVEERLALQCLDWDEDEPAQLDTDAFQGRWGWFDYSTDIEYHTAVNRARMRPDVHQALVTVQRAFAEAANLPLMQLV